MKKRTLTLLLSAVMCLSLAACAGGGAQPSEEPTPTPAPDLTGEWKQVDGNSEENYQTATITADTIEIYWVSDGGDTKSLYWAGSFTAPTTADQPYTWDSENDTEKTSTALLASSDDTKAFTYENGQISYEVSALGTTTTVKMEKQ
ncbi:hypothetical protein AAEU42_10230 [Pseudoflavonifractor phocaeensis]|uniref:hypothetical protein n=1 Tax=Pseudoflavonifractor phocaeensis TaxID=1870988 RepID=UPI00313C79A1